jgi:exodeoxyribonuclease V alpha subunit
LDEVSLAYAITIHKSQGSEFPAVVIPVAMQHFMPLERNLIYTGITRARKFLVVVGQKKALGMAVRNDQWRKRYSGLLGSLKETGGP